MSNKITFNPHIRVGQNESITLFDDYINKILTTLGLEESIKIRIQSKFNKYNDPTKYRIITDARLQQKIQELITADIEITKLSTSSLLSDYLNDAEIKALWAQLLEELAIMQGYIILQKIPYGCDEVIKIITDALDKKLVAANQILESAIVSTSTGTGAARKKYLKHYIKQNRTKYNKYLPTN